MKYLYFPGCSLKSSGKLYEMSLLSVLKKLDVEVEELKDWNCCGATNYISINENYAIEITSRNLAIAEKQGGHDLMVPCAACFMGLLKTKNYVATDPEIRQKVCKALTQNGLSCNFTVNVRHPLDIIVNEIGLDKIKEAINVKLNGKKVACYYGCQLVRPFSPFDNVNNPHTMDDIMKAIGADPIDWPLKTRCCSGSMTSTMPEIGERMNYVLLKEAKMRGAEAILTACPLCQFNLECFQGKISRKFKEDVRMPIMYFTQIMGMAF